MLDNKYIKIIEDYQKNANHSVNNAKELVEAFGSEVPFPTEEELNALILEVREECKNKLSDYISEEFLAYKAIILHITRGVGIGTFSK